MYEHFLLDIPPKKTPNGNDPEYDSEEPEHYYDPEFDAEWERLGQESEEIPNDSISEKPTELEQKEKIEEEDEWKEV